MTTTAYAALGLTLCETARSHTASNRSADFKQLCDMRVNRMMLWRK